ncbi:MAG: homoserine O-succinyltransferase [Deltaproteobacteria bacterium]|nr:homoserine O-succinyltransferase [Deltaproteobacteria bacterium]MBT4092281.1 homoserine O-succinyltransferase [Deltaproteobacteria bacterium]MBT4269734.1 homoserine O-succinyltransferase [Deltaproteobacteria bacterium]MBT4637479.1 homoserine O-succinyltransferase [Deltaproteobacteria bacterium]MBT6502828.1 homoserine O-succinyltransferase [Deltaproteobacteria bacterium]
MTIIIPKHYHAKAALESTHIDCISIENAAKQDIRPLRIGILNIMPNVQTYEFNLLYPLGKSILQIIPVWIKLSMHQYHSSSQEHLNDLYVTFREAIHDRPLDGLIITGAPVEELGFEEVQYWDEVVSIIDFARKNITSTLGICWGGMALAKTIGIEKTPFETKLFGVFNIDNIIPGHPITGDLDDVFQCPQSRHSGYPDELLELERDKGNLNLLGHSEDAGYVIFETTDRRLLMHMGHPEYNSGRLVEETYRDKAKNRTDVKDPVNFDFENPVNRWRSHRNEFFSQWIKYIYRETSYNWTGSKFQ